MTEAPVSVRHEARGRRWRTRAGPQPALPTGPAADCACLTRMKRLRGACRFDQDSDRPRSSRKAVKRGRSAPLRAATAARARMPSGPIRFERHCKWGRRFGYSLRPGLPFICPVMVIDPTYLGATVVVGRALCLTSYNLSLTRKTCLFTDGHQAGVCAVRRGSTRASASHRATRNRFLLWFLKPTRLFLSPNWGLKRPISSLDS